MKKIIIPIFVGIVLISFLYKGWQAKPILKHTEVIVVAYYSEPCVECPALEHTLYRLKWFFGREPVDFYAYNPANQPETLKIQEALEKHGIWQEVKKAYQTGTASIFTLKNKQRFAVLKSQDEMNIGEEWIKKALHNKATNSVQ